MILGGGSNCQGCGCVTCGSCTRTCQNPRTGAEFQVVNRYYFFGAITGLSTDGYLTFSGDEDNPAFIGSGPFYQKIGGTFNLNSTQTRLPCSLTVSFWRKLFPADATTDTALTSNTVTFTCNTGQFVISPANIVLNAGESYTFSPAVPLVASLSGDPRSSEGTFGGFATCNNTQVAISARIDWSNPERIHALHGMVRECYEVGTPCATFCSGNPPPSTIYLAITNAAYTGGIADLSWMNGTYVLTRVPEFCSFYEGVVSTDCALTDLFAEQVDSRPLAARYRISPTTITAQFIERVSGLCQASSIEIVKTGTPWTICGTGSLFSGTGATVRTLPGVTVLGTCDWEVTA